MLVCKCALTSASFCSSIWSLSIISSSTPLGEEQKDEQNILQKYLAEGERWGEGHQSLKLNCITCTLS